MIIDASALLAILRSEEAATACAEAIQNSSISRISAANWLEAAIVVDSRKNPVASRRFDELVKVAKVVIEPVTARQAQIARDAYRDFGKGSAQGARLNFGDCFAYALAKDLDEPLLFIGEDFSQTDLKSVLD